MSETYFERYINEEISYDEFNERVNLLKEESDAYNVLGLSEAEFELYKRLGKDALHTIALPLDIDNYTLAECTLVRRCSSVK